MLLVVGPYGPQWPKTVKGLQSLGGSPCPSDASSRIQDALVVGIGALRHRAQRCRVSLVLTCPS
eukprot:6462565-Amphidinium_carterae.1